MTSLGDCRLVLPPNAQIAAAVLAMMIGLVTMVAAHNANTVAAPNTGGEPNRTVATADPVPEVQLVAREARTDRFERSEPLLDTKTDRLPEPEAADLEVEPGVTGMFPALAPELSNEMFSILGQIAP